jgi:DNA-binding SARP family transcriptional activator
MLGLGLELWRGEALADVAEKPFATAEVRRIEELRVHAHVPAGEADLAAGRHAEVIGELEALVAKHPLRDRRLVQRMLTLHRAERRFEALDACGQARSALVEQIVYAPRGVG